MLMVCTEMGSSWESEQANFVPWLRFEIPINLQKNMKLSSPTTVVLLDVQACIEEDSLSIREDIEKKYPELTNECRLGPTCTNFCRAHVAAQNYF